MPLYEYVCQECERTTEVIRRVGERAIRMCPHCGGKVKKAFSAPAIQFKGSGFYITDYAKGGKDEKSSSSSAKAEAESGEKASEKSGEKSSEKPAEKGSEKAPEKKSEKKEKKAAKN
ncbi:MAG: FmdB family zinc ribbon protein [Thermoanaerobaculia bacterium]